MPYYYRLYNLSIESELALTLSAHDHQVDCDVKIHLREKKLSRLKKRQHQCLFYEFDANNFLFNVPGFGQFLMTSGDTITISSERDARTIESFIYYNCLKILLHQRGTFITSGFAVATDHYTAAFLTPWTHGAELLAWTYLEKKYKMTAPFICFQANLQLAQGLPFLLISQAALEKVKAPFENYSPLRKSLSRYIVPLTMHQPFKSKVNKLFILKPTHAPHISFHECSSAQKHLWFQEKYFSPHGKLHPLELDVSSLPICEISLPKSINFEALTAKIDEYLHVREYAV